MTAEQQAVLNGLRREIAGTLYFFVDFDLRMFGRISPGTVEAFEKQKVPFPNEFKELIDNKNIT